MYGTDGQTDKKYKRKVSDVIPFKQKKNFKNQTIRTQNERCTERTDGQTDGQTDKKYKSWVSHVIPFKQKKDI